MIIFEWRGDIREPLLVVSHAPIVHSGRHSPCMSRSTHHNDMPVAISTDTHFSEDNTTTAPSPSNSEDQTYEQDADPRPSSSSAVIDIRPARSSRAAKSKGKGKDDADARATDGDVRKQRERRGKLLKFPRLSLTLQNTGSVARDHLASERTFLAYVRTSLAFASAGVALVQLFSIAQPTDGGKRIARPLGATVVVFGMFVLAVGTTRYFTVQAALPRGEFPAARVTIFVHAVFLALLVGTVFGFVVAVR
ncbi:hypothetical protein BV25DRAFT_1591770 [Artomyces pyxidatus]|uniref:Uncharacterized protein n=1 Tax=Artomyces pyxidatus TaxID=48021 RepID=A0ACB8TCS4_9AGAM|nr:hypothetical protein BV25DRAFT_1591770 [Artomyces pyxidatus]